MTINTFKPTTRDANHHGRNEEKRRARQIEKDDRAETVRLYLSAHALERGCGPPKRYYSTQMINMLANRRLRQRKQATMRNQFLERCF
jgi:hypothetical protein